MLILILMITKLEHHRHPLRYDNIDYKLFVTYMVSLNS